MKERLKLSEIPRRMLGGVRRMWHRIRLGNEVRAGIDASAENRHTDKHFTDADQRDINTVIEADIAVVRQRCRYEVRNNPLLRGIVNSYANHIVGVGPRLQVAGDNKDANKEIEDKFAEWCNLADAGGRMSFGAQLRLDIVEHCQSGESITAFVNAEDPKEYPVQLRLQSIAPIRLGTPWGARYAEDYRDGIKVDKNGKPLSYAIMKSHPGGSYNVNIESDDVPARDIIHLFPIIESGQYRGFPLVAPCVTLAGDLRRYTKATVAAAEAAADVAGVIESTDPEKFQEVDVFDEIEIPRRSLLTMPDGWHMNQLKAEQPATGYKDFKAELVNEMGSPILMPYIVAALNSQGYNYASGRLDWQAFWKAIAVVQAGIAIEKCDRVFDRWYLEARLIAGYLTHAHKGKLSLQWFWPGSEHVDPAKEATAQEKRLKNNTSTLADEYARKGQDWERQLDQRKREKEKELEIVAELKEKRDELGLSAEDIAAFTSAKAAAPLGRAKTNLGSSEIEISDRALSSAEIKKIHGHAPAKANTVEWYFHNRATHGDNVGYQHCEGGPKNPYKLEHFSGVTKHGISKEYARGHGEGNLPQWWQFSKTIKSGWWDLSSGVKVDVKKVPGSIKCLTTLSA